MASTTNAAPVLFDAARLSKRLDNVTIEVVALEECELAPNYRKRIDPDGIVHLSELMMRNGQIQPTTGWREPDTGKVLIYSGQRRYLAAHKSHELAGTQGYEQLAPITGLRVMLFSGKRAPTKQEIQRLQAMENQGREPVGQADLQDQFIDCWRERAGLPDDERIAAVCQDMGITAKQAHNLRKQVTLPEEIRHRVANKRRTGNDISISLANQLADIHQTSPDLAQAVAERVSSDELHEAAIRDLGAFVHMTTIEDESVYSVRLNQGQLLQAADQLAKARKFITGDLIARAAEALKCEPDKVADELDALASRAKTTALLITVDEALLDRITVGNFGWRFGRGERFADSIWLTDAVFMVDTVLQAADGQDATAPAQEASYFASAGASDQEAQEAAAEVAKQREAQRERQQNAAQRNIGLGQDIAAKLTDPSGEQLDALRRLVCHLLLEQYPDAIAYGAGWTNPARMQPVGDTSRYEPKAPTSVLEAELEQALNMRDPLAGIARLAASFGAAFMLDLDGVPRTKTLGTDRMSRKLREALPGGDHPAREALWDFMRPMLSPALVQMHHDEFVAGETVGSTVDLEAHRAASSLDDIDLGSDALADAA